MSQRKLSDVQVAEIEKLLKNKTPFALSKELGIHVRILTEIKQGIYINKTKPKQSKESRDYPKSKQERVLTPAQVREIRTKLKANEAPSRVAKQYKVHPDTIRRIANNESYRDVR